MKKTIKSLLAIAIAAFAFTACSDVPEPDGYSTDKGQKTVIEPAGDGSQTDPFNVAAAINKCKETGTTETAESYYIKGKVAAVSEAFTSQYGNGTFTISDDGKNTNTFTAYRVMYLGNKKFTDSDTQIQPGDEVIIYGKIVYFKGNTPETVQGSAYLYSLNGKTAGGEGGEGSKAEAKGTGTQADPYNVAAVLNYINTLGADTNSPSEVYVKGKVKSITEQFGAQYGNATFTMIDEGFTATFTAYRVLYLGNKKYASGDLLKEGDEVIVCGKVVNFKGNTPETVQGSAYLYSLNGKTDGGGEVTPGEPKGTGTQADPFNVAAAVKKCKETGETVTTESYYIKGIADADYTVGSYKNIEIEIVDQAGATEKFKVYRVKKADNKDVKVGFKINKGEEIIVYGPVVNYKGNTPETATGSYIVSVNGQEVPEDDGSSSGGGGEAATSLTNGNFEAWDSATQPTGWKSASSASSATLAQSTDAHGGSYSCNINGGGSSNKRLASQEIKLAAGTYVFKFYAKATTANKAQVCPGYVPVTDGKVGSYKYGSYADINNTGWTEITNEFTLDAETTLCLIVMNPKSGSYSSGEDALVDDATLTKK